MYVRVTDGNAVYTTLTDMRRENPNVSFPAVISDEDAAMFDVYPCADVEPPAVNYTENATMGAPALVNGKWTQTWTVTPASADEIKERLDSQWDAVRSERNGKLAASDWTQLPDAPFTEAQKQDWANYRQALRDVTDQSDPFNIQWPAEPKG